MPNRLPHWPEGGGVDLLIIETMPALNEAREALKAAKEVAPDLPVLVMVTVDDDSICLDGSSPAQAAALLTEWGADAIGVNCSTGPATVLTAIEAMRAATTLPLAAMPNAGMPRAVEGRNIYLCSPEYMASFARKAIAAGRSWSAAAAAPRPIIFAPCARPCGRSMSKRALRLRARRRLEQRDAARAAGRSVRASARWSQRASFMTLVEIVPPRGIDCPKEIEGAQLLAQLGVHAINVHDSPQASARMSAQSLCIQIQQHTGIETILHYTCRDRNMLSIQSDLLGPRRSGCTIFCASPAIRPSWEIILTRLQCLT